MCVHCHSTIWTLRAFLDSQCDHFQIEMTPDLMNEADEMIDAFMGAMVDWLITRKGCGVEEYSLANALEKAVANPPGYILQYGSPNHEERGKED